MLKCNIKRVYDHSANMSFPTTPSFNRNEQTRFINQLITLNGHTLIPRHFLYIYLRNRLLMGSFSRFTNKAHSPLRPSLFAVFRTGFGGGWRSPRCVFGALGSKRIVRLFCVCAPGVIENNGEFEERIEILRVFAVASRAACSPR